MKAIIHIGTEKTGSTTVQFSLNHNRKRLINCGYHYLQSLGRLDHRLLQIMCEQNVRADRNDYFKNQGISDQESAKLLIDKGKKELKDELSSLPKHIHTVIFSSEHFHSRLHSVKEVETLKEILLDFFEKFKIIVYLRHQADVVESLYSTVVKGGISLPFDEFVEKRCKPEAPYFSYKDMLDRWSSVFGRESMIVRLFRKDMFINNDLLEDFYGQIDQQLFENLDTNIFQTKNQSLSFWGLALAKAINVTLLNDKKVHEKEKTRRRIISMLDRLFPGKGERLSFETWNKIDDIYFKQNQELQRDYFPDCEEIFLKRKETKRVTPTIEADFQLRLNKVVNLMLTSNVNQNSEHARILEEAAKTVEKQNLSLAIKLRNLAEEGKSASDPFNQNM